MAASSQQVHELALETGEMELALEKGGMGRLEVEEFKVRAH